LIPAGTGQDAGEIRIYVVFGGATVGQDGPIELSALDGTNGFLMTGETLRFPNAHVNAAGDVNGDGFADVVVGVSGVDSPNGRAWVVFGSSEIGAGGSLSLSALDGSNGFALLGNADFAGYAVGGPGDVNGDGYADILVGVSDEPGQEYLAFGGPNVGSGGQLALSDLNGKNGFAIVRPANSGFTSAVDGAGDVNRDGYADVAIGSPFYSPTGNMPWIGSAFVLFGGAHVGESGTVLLADLDGTDGFALTGTAPPIEELGFDLGGVDMNGDGYSDVLSTANIEGPAFVVFGASDVGDSGEVDLAGLDGIDGFVAESADSSWINGAGDVNGDGFGDIITSDGYSVAYVLFGRDTIGQGGRVDLSALDGFDGFAMFTPDLLNRVSGAGDVNGDGLKDVVVSAARADPNGSASGAVYVVFGRLADADEDGVLDARDNCILDSNADQRDTDGDGYGNVCDADLNQDGVVNFVDLGLFKTVFFNNDPDADFDGDGNVNFRDLAQLKADFFKPPGPSGLAP
jgi:hypothetical protein